MKKILAITSTRADFGILSNILKKINSDKFFNLKLIVTGSHTSKKFGDSFSEIPSDFKKIKIKFNFSQNTQQNIAKNSSLIIKNVSKIIQKEKPDFFLVLGDRFEIFCSSYSALINYIPIIHIHGGELTKNSLDDIFRHSISKMANIHFVSHERYKKRLIQIGEKKKNIFCFGGLGAENIKNANFISKFYLEKKFKFKFKEKNILVTYHPETIKTSKNLDNFKVLLKTCMSLKQFNFIFTYPNFDFGSKALINLLEKSKNQKNISVIKTFGHLNYLSLIKYSDLMIGNSSSGILEAPSLKKIAINIGDRQNGREFSNNIINCKITKKELKKKINQAYKLKNSIKINNIYYKKNCSNNIIATIKKIKHNELFPKTFVDLNTNIL